MNISLFKNVSEVKNPEILDLIDYLSDTRDGKWEDIVNKCRNIKDKSERDAYKREMPTACLSGVFTYRSDINLVTHSEIIAMDLDDVDDLNDLKNRLKKDRYTFSVFMSTGGRGLRWLCKIEPSKHTQAFKALCQYLFEVYGVSADLNSSLSKPYVVSFDPDLYLNPEYNNLPVFNKYIKETVVKSVPSYIHNDDDFKSVFNQVIGRRINLCENYDDWVRIGFGLSECFGEDGRYYFHELSKISEKYKYTVCDKQFTHCLKHKTEKNPINIKTFYFLAKGAGISIVTERTKEIVRVTKNAKRAGLKPAQIAENLKTKGGIEGVENLIENIYNSQDKETYEDDEESIIGILEMFINNSYHLRFNEVSGFFEDNGNQITPTSMNSIFIAAKKILPKLNYDLMIRLLKSDFVPTFNPFFEFFKSDGIPVILPPIPEDNGKKFESPLIDKLASCIINDNEAYTRYFLRKWLVSIVSAAHKVHSPLLFCLLGPQHTGKTEFFRRLMPKELQQYYAESKLDKEKDDELLMTENLIIMDDELGGKSKADALKLKNITSKQWFSLRRPYGDHNEKLLRLAVLCGTSNMKQIMSDPSGNRRIIATEVKDIDKSKYNSINKKELFMEMFRLYKEGFDWRVVPADNKLLNQDEEKYSVTIRERELIMKYYQPSDVDYISTTDMMVEIEKLTNQKLNINIVGRELDYLGFIRKSVRTGQFKTHVKSLWGIERINRFEGLGPNAPAGKQPNDSGSGFKPIDESKELPF
jgi:hypothetical protein